MSKTIGTIFSGIGGVEFGAKALGIEPIWGIERDSTIAKFYRANIGAHVIVKDAFDVLTVDLERPDILWASPPCQNASIARHMMRSYRPNGKIPVHPDYDAGDAVPRYLYQLRPDWFFLENVENYLKEESFSFIIDTLFTLGYHVERYVIQASQIGIPQDRRRLFLVANRIGKKNHLPDIEQPTVGWWAALEDMWATLPAKSPAPWLAKLIYDDEDNILIDTKRNLRKYGPTVCKRPLERPSFTCVCAFGGRPAFGLVDGRYRSITARAWARLQTFPDTVKLPYKEKTAMKMIGNAVPPEMARQLLEANL